VAARLDEGILAVQHAGAGQVPKLLDVRGGDLRHLYSRLFSRSDDRSVIGLVVGVPGTPGPVGAGLPAGATPGRPRAGCRAQAAGCFPSADNAVSPVVALAAGTF